MIIFQLKNDQVPQMLKSDNKIAIYGVHANPKFQPVRASDAVLLSRSLRMLAERIFPCCSSSGL